MPENEFEKKVSDRLGDFKLKPSDDVWEKVEEGIRRKKKRRVFILIFLLAGLALLGYWQWDIFFGESKGSVVKNETPSLEKNDPTNENIQTIKEEEDKPNNKSTESRQDINTNNSVVNINKKKTSAQEPTSKIENNNHQTNRIKQKTVENKTPDQSPENKGANDRNKPAQNKTTITLTESDLAIMTDEPSIVKDSAKTKYVPLDNVDQNSDQNSDQKNNIVDNKIDLVKIDTLLKIPGVKKDTVVKAADTVVKKIPVDSPIVRIPKSSFDKKWKFGIEFIPGISSFHEDFPLLSFNANKSADLYASPVGGGSSAAPSGPVKSHSGFAFQFGGFFKKQFTKKSSVTVGLRWAYYSEELRIGAKMIPSLQSPVFTQILNALGATAAYDAGGINFYATNKYHFFEVPVNYNVRLNKNEVHPLNLQVGVKVGQLFTSNALVYDTSAGGIYYSSKKYFNKTQFGISTSLNWKITKKDKFYMAVGPVLDMHLNSLLDNPFDKKKYLLFTGIRTTVIFNSKK